MITLYCLFSLEAEQSYSSFYCYSYSGYEYLQYQTFDAKFRHYDVLKVPNSVTMGKRRSRCHLLAFTPWWI